MHKSLTQYFAQNGQLILPNIGIIKWHKQDAEWVNSKLVAPKEEILFEKIDSKPSKSFYHFLSDQLEVSYDQAIIQYENYIANLFNEEQLTFELGNFGTLSKNNGLYYWTTHFSSKAYFKDIEITKIDLQADLETKKDTKNISWYRWTILLAALAILAILFKYI
jgi:hypothetical protein